MKHNSTMISTLASLVAAASLGPSISEALANAQVEPHQGIAGYPQVVPAKALEVVAFWREAGPALWFAKDPAFDRRFHDRFIGLYESASQGKLSSWMQTPDGALALIILLDQYPRNSFRGTPRMYATDELARQMANDALARGYDRKVANDLALFMYLPFGHSESLSDQDRSVALSQRLGQPNIAHAEGHRDIIRRFGRFPHRNPILGRAMRAEEQEYLDNGGFQG